MAEDTVIIIVGPTAAGKTAAAIRLAQQLGAEIISADSRQCFRELNIGVARPSPEELAIVHHYFIASHAVTDKVTAATFEELALDWTAGLHAQGRPVVMVGGTGLYIKAFCEGLDPIPPIDPGIRQEVQEQYQLQGVSWLQEQVRLNDPEYFQQGEILNPHRLLRALEVKLSTNHSILSYRTGIVRPRPFRIIKIGLEMPREHLYARINDRVDKMMAQGLLAEVAGLLPYRDHNALHTVGYRELFDHLDGTISLAAAIEAIKVNTRRYAKRQMTWFRRDPGVRWIEAGRQDNMKDLI